MILLVFEAGGERYGVPAARIREVLPAPALRPLPGAHACVAGVFSYHGEIVPVIDASVLLAGRPAAVRLSTRILLFTVEPLHTGHAVLLALLAEHATEAIACAPEEFQAAGVREGDAPYAGGVLVRSGGLIQEIDPDRLLAPDLQEQLFPGAAAHI